jgi:hypothetical protein
MNTLRLLPTVGATLLGICQWSVPTTVLGVDDPPAVPPRSVAAKELFRRITLVGSLQRSHGTVVTLKGTWTLAKEITRGAGSRFRVTAVEGRELVDPVEFAEELVRPMSQRAFAMMTPKSGTTWELRGYERCEFFGVSADGDELLAEYQTDPYRCWLVFSYFQAREVRASDTREVRSPTAPAKPPARRSQGQSDRPTVHAGHLIERVPVIGTLGYPLGKLLWVRGSWLAPDSHSEGELRFSITHANGKSLPEPVAFPALSVAPVIYGLGQNVVRAIGTSWELHGFEDARVYGLPFEAIEELGLDHDLFGRPGFQIEPQFRCVEARQVTRSTPLRTPESTTSTRNCDGRAVRPGGKSTSATCGNLSGRANETNNRRESP